MDQKSNNRVLLVIMDGWGLGKIRKADAIQQAETPFVDGLYKSYPNSQLITWGPDVGLPKGQMGNSEVGHLNIGAGRIVYQELLRINNAIVDGSFEKNTTLNKAIKYAKEKHARFHLIGLVSDGGIHSHINHFKKLIEVLDKHKLDETFIHAFTDGRDTDPKSGVKFISELIEFTNSRKAVLASIIGRYYAMDRDKRWERIKRAYDLLIHGKGFFTDNPIETMNSYYDRGTTDEFMEPILIDKTGIIRKNDVVLCANFRTDRLRQLTSVLTQEELKGNGMTNLPLKYVTMTEYDARFRGIDVMFETENIKNTLGEVISQNGLTQLRITETEKYPHVTFFFSGGREEPFTGEKRILIASPKVATYDLQPEMSAYLTTDAAIEEIQESKPYFICLNYANTDMVGHTGVFQAAVKAVETVDQCLNRLVRVALDHGYYILAIADHGNSDFMINKDGTPNTAHTMNPVPCILISSQNHDLRLKDGILADVAPTILYLMKLNIPEEMTGHILLEK